MEDWIDTALEWHVTATPVYNAGDEEYIKDKGYNYAYFSPYRPLSFVSGIDCVLVFSTLAGADFIFTREPLFLCLPLRFADVGFPDWTGRGRLRVWRLLLWRGRGAILEIAFDLLCASPFASLAHCAPPPASEVFWAASMKSSSGMVISICIRPSLPRNRPL